MGQIHSYICVCGLGIKVSAGLPPVLRFCLYQSGLQGSAGSQCKRTCSLTTEHTLTFQHALLTNTLRDTWDDSDCSFANFDNLSILFPHVAE